MLFAEKRFAQPDGYGVLLTNGTGTGKTFSGLGVVKRFKRQGKTNTLLLAPNDKIIEDWIRAAAMLGLDVTQLADTKDAGKGIVITTYANAGTNAALASRTWDLVVADEAHYLSSGKDGALTEPAVTLRAVSLHPDGARARADMLHAELLEREREAWKAVELARKSDDERDWHRVAELEKKAEALTAKMEAAREEVLQDVMARQGAARPRAVFLSATPFAYEFNIEWAQGFLFDWHEGQKPDGSRAYNAGDNRAQFFMRHFGYRMRYNKLTQPEGTVDRGLMQRQFNGWLKQRGVLSGRMLDVDADYDRRFVLVESGIGNRIDEALRFDDHEAIKNLPDAERMARSDFTQRLRKSFDYLKRQYLLEAIKADAAVPYLRGQLARGRKVVVFHDFKKGGVAGNPFAIRLNDEAPEAMRKVASEFASKFPDLVNLDLSKLRSPIETLTAAFPGKVGLFNGDVPSRQGLANVGEFIDDDSGPRVLLVQSAKAEGWSGHDTSGKHQRVLLNLGMPVRPFTAIQQEGRIYRTGQVSDAIFRYLNTGTYWERDAFAQKIAQRASAAENLAMGEQARALKDSFIAAFEGSDAYAPGHEGEGKGGKDADRLASAALTEYDRARSFYFATQRKTSKTKAAEGADYFATPEPVGLKMVQWADLRGNETVLEPSAGHGAIARWFPDHVKGVTVEPSSELRSRLALAFNGDNATVRDGTFEDFHVVNKADAIVMNPPFGVGGKTAWDHVAKAVKHLREGGRIVALVPRGNMADRRMEAFLASDEAEGLSLVADVQLPNVTFERAGTAVATRIIVLDKGPLSAGVQKQRDYSDITDIRELFERLENVELPPRAKVEPVVEAAPAKPVKGPDASSVQAAGGFTTFDFPHSKTGATMYGAAFASRVERDVYDQANKAAKALGGWYSSFKGGQAKPGFLFKTATARDEFVKLGSGEAPKYSRTEGGAGGMPVAAVRAAVERITRRWTNAPEVVVVADMSDPRVPRALRTDDAAARSEGGAGDAEGAFYDGKVYLVASQLGSEADVQRVLFHEALGHYGLRGVFGADMEGVLRMVAQGREEVIRQKLHDYGLRDTAENRMQAAEEVLAELAQTRPELGIVRRALAVIRSWIRRVLGQSDAALSDDDIVMQFLEPARRFVEQAPAVAPGAFADTQPMVHRYSRAAAAAPGAEAVREFLKAASAGTTRRFNALHRTLSTQMHKAWVDRDYAEVFQQATQYERDIARAASRPAELAPDLLPTFDDARSAVARLLHGDKDEAGVRKVAQALFAGTLENGPEPHTGVIWSPAELRERFGLDDRQVRLYQQARAAIDASLDETASALAYELVKAYAPPELRDQLRAAPGAAREAIMATMDGHPGKGAAEAMRDALAVLDRAAELKAGGYSPLMRFGRYAVDVIGKDGERLHFEKFQTELQAKVAASRLAKQYPGAAIERSVMSEQDYKLFAGVDPESVALFANQLAGKIDDDALQEWYRNAVSERSAFKRMIGPRKGMAGYSSDLRRVLASFITSNARLSARQLNMGDMAATIADMRERKVSGDVIDEAIKLKEYLDNADEPFKTTRGLMFAWYMGGSIASAAVNLTQPLMMTLPYLSQFGNASKALLGAAREAATGRVDDAQLRAALKRAAEDGKVDPQEVHHLYHEGMSGFVDRLPFFGKVGTDLKARAQGFSTLWGWFFGAAENFNRRITFIAAYRMAQDKPELGDPYAFAVRTIDETQGMYGKANRPNWARGTGSFGAVGVLAFTFKQYSIAYVELLVRLAKSGPRGKWAALSMLGMLALAGGAQGLPGADDLEDLVDTVLQRLGYRGNSRAAVREQLVDWFGTGVADVVMYGGSAALPLDVAGRLGMGNLLPATALLKPSEDSKASQLAELIGPAGGLAKQVGDALDAADSGKGMGAVLGVFAPLAIRNAMMGVQMASTGEYRDTRGRKVTDVDGVDAAVKAIGFQPTSVAEKRRPEQLVRQDISRVRQVESDIADLRAQAMMERDPDLRARADTMLQQWNARNPELRIVINDSQVLRRVREMRRTSADRLVSTAPKETRRAMADQLE